MDFGYDSTTESWLARVGDFMTELVYPAEPVLDEQLRARENPWSRAPVVEELKAAAKARGLWNLFLPAAHGGPGLTNVQYAPLAEIMGRSIQLAPEAFNCAAPDTGNMEVLALFGTPEQKERWLEPLLEGTTRSAFAMTEPDVASSDATNIRLSMVRDGDSYVLNGRKWFSSGALAPEVSFVVVMALSDPDADRRRTHSMIIVPVDTEGMTVRRGLSVLGYDDSERGGHAEITFEDARVPAANVIAGEGEGFAIAQARLGPGRIHHCMRAIGLAERAIDLLCQRANSRVAFGRPLAEQGVIRDWVAEAVARVEQARLLVMKAAWMIDTAGTKAAHNEIQLAKIITPQAVEWVLDKAIQVHGAAGLTQDFPLAYWYSQIRTHRIVDGPDEVHKSALGKRKLASYAGG